LRFIREICEVLICGALAPIGFTLPLRPSRFPLRPLGCSSHRRPRSLSRTVHPPVSFGLLQSLTKPARRPTAKWSSSFHEVPLPHRAIATACRLVTTGTSPPPPSALRFSQPLGGFIPASLRGLVSSRRHVQAFPFRVFPSQGAVPPSGGRCPPAVAAGPPPLRANDRQSVFRALLPLGIRCAPTGG
jgi:hypothetical protein